MVDFLIVAQNGGGGAGGLLTSLIPLAIIFLIFYFLLIRPEQKKREKQEDFREGLQAGDKVVTAGGLFGEVTKVDDETDTVKLKVGRNKPMRVMRSQIRGAQEEFLGGEDDED